MMLFLADTPLNSTSLTFLIITPLIASVFLCIALVFCIKIIRQQILLHHSIVLVELKSPKSIYWVLFFGAIAIILYLAVSLISMPSYIEEFFQSSLHMEKSDSVIVLGCLMVVFFSVAIIFLTLAASKCALVDRGVYTKIVFFDWYHIYDYFVDEKKNTVVLSRNKRGPLSLSGMSPPLKYKKEDVEKLKFILNKNKNKFLAKYELR